MSLEFHITDISGDVKASLLSMGEPIAAAGTQAVFIAGNTTITLGQGDIRAAGFGARWANTWKVKFYQVSPPQIDAAAWVYHKIPYAEIFEDGGIIVGRPMLWIPLRNAPLAIGQGGGRLSPKRLIQKGVKLFSIERAGKPPLLATKLLVSRAQANAKKTQFNVTAKKLLNSRVLFGEHTGKNAGKLVPMTVPLFFGIKAVHEKKLFHLHAIADSQMDALPGYYDAALGALVTDK